MGMGRGALRSRPAYQPRKEARELRADLGQLTGCGRVFRDARVAAQHIGLSTNAYEIAGQVLLGLDPGTPRF